MITTEDLVDWINQFPAQQQPNPLPGPQGSQGPQGPIGPIGPQGPAGASAGVSPDSLEGLLYLINLFGVKKVKSEQEFLAAVRDGNHSVLLERDININSNVVITKPISVYSLNKSAITFNGQALEYLFDLRASVLFYGVHFKGTSRDFGRCFNLGGPRFSGYIKFNKCTYENMGNVFTVSGGSTSPLAPLIEIKNCTIKSCGSKNYTSIGKYGVIELAWNIGKVEISNNDFEDVYSNGIWVGQSKDSEGFINENRIKAFGRNAIETFGADNLSICENVIKNGTGAYGGAGMGISIAADNCIVTENRITNAYSYGIEVYQKNNIVSHNIIDGISIDVTGQVGLGISIDACTNSTIEGNIIQNIKYGAKSPRFGMQLNNNSNFNSIKDNKFYYLTEGIRLLSGDHNSIQNNEFSMSWDANTLASSCQPAIIIFFGENNVVTNNFSKLLKAGNVDGSFFLSAGRRIFADFSGKQLVAPVGGMGFTNRLGNSILNNTNMSI
jgi:parallel beta-helix repeat protein